MEKFSMEHQQEEMGGQLESTHKNLKKLRDVIESSLSEEQLDHMLDRLRLKEAFPEI
jgi:hypothetical protein